MKYTIKQVQSNVIYDFVFAFWKAVTDGYWFAAIDDNNEVLGAGCLSEWINNQAYLGSSIVVEKARNQGIHRKLIQQRLLLARTMGYKTAVAHVHDFNTPCLNNFLKEGFVERSCSGNTIYLIINLLPIEVDTCD